MTNDNGGSVGKHAAAHAAPNLTEQLSQALPTVNVEAVNQSTGNPVITFDHVTKIYAAQPNKPALDDVSAYLSRRIRFSCRSFRIGEVNVHQAAHP